jgi:hypothetical protein
MENWAYTMSYAKCAKNRIALNLKQKQGGNNMDNKKKELIQKIKTISRNGFRNIETINDNDIKLLLENIKSPDNEIVEKIYWAVGQIGIHKPEKVEHLINYAFEDLKNESSEIRDNALFAIGRTGRANINLVKDRMDEIIKLHKDNNAKVRMSMIWACENIANSEADLFEPYISVFEEMLDDIDDEYVKKEIPEIFRVIGKYKPKLVEKSLGKLKSKLNDSNKVMRIHIDGAIKVIEKGLKVKYWRTSYKMNYMNEVKMKCKECYSENSRITPLNGAEECLTKHRQYICSKCGRIVCIDLDGERKARCFFPFKTKDIALLYLKCAEINLTLEDRILLLSASSWHPSTYRRPAGPVRPAYQSFPRACSHYVKGYKYRQAR